MDTEMDGKYGNRDDFPALSSYKVETEAEKEALLSRIFSRILYNNSELTVPTLIPLEVNGVFLGNGAFMLMLFSLTARQARYIAVVDRMYDEAKQIIRRELSAHSIAYVAEIDGIVMAITCYHHYQMSPIDAVPTIELCHSSCMAVCQALEELGIECHAYLSEPFAGTDKLHTAYVDVYDRMQMDKEMRLPQETVTLCRSVSEKEKLERLDYLYARANEIARLANAGKLDTMLEKLGELFDGVLREAPSSAAFALDIQAFVLLFLGALEVKNSILVKQDMCFPFLVSMRSGEKSAEEIKAEFLQTMTHAARLRRDHGSADERITGEMIRNYIDEHLNEMSLSTSQIADYFSIPQPRLSTIYLKTSGEHITDYIHRQRVKAAARLLKETDIPVNEVYEKVGYGSKITMYRAFVKYYGVSPARLRHPQSETDSAPQ